jgi:hypothetical protein
VVIPVIIPPGIGGNQFAFVDPAGYVWIWDPYTGAAAMGANSAPVVFYTTADCSGTPYFAAPFQFPARFTFTVPVVDALVHVLPDAPSAQTIGFSSLYNGSCNPEPGGPYSLTVIPVSATLPATPLTPPTTPAIGDTLHPVYTP